MNLAADWEHQIDKYWCLLRDAKTPAERREYCDKFTRSIRARNAERTPAEIAELERAKGLQ